MTNEHQQCGNCNALNPVDAIICVNCGTVLAANAPVPSPESPALTPVPPPTSPISTQATQRGSDWRNLFGEVTDISSKPLDFLSASSGTAPAEPDTGQQSSRPTDRGSDWRDLFAHAPGSDRKALDFSSLPAAPSLPEPPRLTGSPAVAPEQATETPSEQQPIAVEMPTVDVLPAAVPVPARQSRKSIPVASFAPLQKSGVGRAARFDRGMQNRSPQSLILYGIMIFVIGCILALVLSALGSSDTLVGLLIFCAGPLGFIVVVIGIILAVARREGRQR